MFKVIAREEVKEEEDDEETCFCLSAGFTAEAAPVFTAAASCKLSGDLGIKKSRVMRPWSWSSTSSLSHRSSILSPWRLLRVGGDEEEGEDEEAEDEEEGEDGIIKSYPCPDKYIDI